MTTSGSPVAPLDALISHLIHEVIRRPIGLDDDFFLAGGSSLELMRLQGRVIQECGVEIPFEDVFANRTPRGIARLVERAQFEAAGPVEIDALTRSIEDMSEDQAETLLEQLNARGRDK